MKNRLLPAVLLASIALSCGEKKATEATPAVDPLNISYTVISTLPHETDAFTEGLTIHSNKVLESTGQNGKSWVAEVDPGTGAHNKKIVLDYDYESYKNHVTPQDAKDFFAALKQSDESQGYSITYNENKEIKPSQPPGTKSSYKQLLSIFLVLVLIISIVKITQRK